MDKSRTLTANAFLCMRVGDAGFEILEALSIYNTGGYIDSLAFIATENGSSADKL